MICCVLIIQNFYSLRKAALEVEKNRAAQIAALPPPPPDPLQEINLPQNQSRCYIDLPIG